MARRDQEHLPVSAVDQPAVRKTPEKHKKSSRKSERSKKWRPPTAREIRELRDDWDHVT